MEVKMISKTLMAASTRPIILTILHRQEDYGYNIIQKVREISGGSLAWTDGMLYPVLQRMEMDGLIVSRWKTAPDCRPRRYYQITEAGRLERTAELAGWRDVWTALSRLGEPLPAQD
jgi:PadR family transcriptional regulator PadR